MAGIAISGRLRSGAGIGAGLGCRKHEMAEHHAIAKGGKKTTRLLERP